MLIVTSEHTPNTGDVIARATSTRAVFPGNDDGGGDGNNTTHSIDAISGYVTTLMAVSHLSPKRIVPVTLREYS